MNERMFLYPLDGEIHPESFYIRENIDLCCVIEAHKMPDGIAFDINPENIEHMQFRDIAVIELIADFTKTLAVHAMETDDPEVAEHCGSIAAYVSRIMMEKLSGTKIPKH